MATISITLSINERQNYCEEPVAKVSIGPETVPVDTTPLHYLEKRVAEELDRAERIYQAYLTLEEAKAVQE